MATATSTHLLFMRQADTSAPAADYVVRLLARLVGARLTCLSPEGAMAAERQETREGVVLVHAGDAGEGGANALLNLLPPHLQTSQTLVIPRHDDFWNALKDPRSLPVNSLLPVLEAAARRELDRQFHVASETSRVTVAGKDLLAACLWMITRAEEYGAAAEGKLDQQGRFLASSSAAPPEVYDQPVVAHILIKMWQKLMPGNSSPLPAGQTVALTHDVDLLRKFGGAGGWKRLASRMARTPAGAFTEARKGLPVLLGNARDPYDSFDDLFSIKERISAPSTWFLMAEKGGLNADYALEDTRLRNVLVRARGFRDEFAVHTSWESGGSASQIERERTKVERGTGGSVAGARPHYLRFGVPGTWHNMARAGLRYSSSLAFADRAGFRCGWSGPFRPFDLATMQELPVTEIPLICMDVTLSVYEKVPAELALERLTNLLDAASEGIPRGAFVFLWHNTIADRAEHPGYWDTFEYFFSIASGSSTFVTLTEICEEYDAHTSRVE